MEARYRIEERVVNKADAASQKNRADTKTGSEQEAQDFFQKTYPASTFMWHVFLSRSFASRKKNLRGMGRSWVPVYVT